jgi:hypothetical protein
MPTTHVPQMPPANHRPEHGLVNFWGETFAVRAGLRPAALIETPPELLETHLQYLDKHGIFHAELSQTELSSLRNERSTRASSDRAPRAIMVYITRKKQNIQKLINLDARDKSEQMGRLLGYPECCIAWFQKKKKNPSLKNNAKKYFKYISHEPCSKKCIESVRMEKQLEEEIRKYREDTAAVPGAASVATKHAPRSRKPSRPGARA